MTALPRNQKIPQAPVNKPYADGRRFAGTIVATAAGMIDSCTPMPRPHRADPINAAAKPPRKTRGVASAEMIVSGMSTTIPKRSNSFRMPGILCRSPPWLPIKKPDQTHFHNRGQLKMEGDQLEVCKTGRHQCSCCEVNPEHPDRPAVLISRGTTSTSPGRG
jgi:hypothetical protein